jgi:hypothetical protein
LLAVLSEAAVIVVVVVVMELRDRLVEGWAAGGGRPG